MTKPNNTIVPLTVTLDELQAISNLLHGNNHIRYDSEDPWTAEKLIRLRAHIDNVLFTHKPKELIP